MGILEWATNPWGQYVPIHIAWFLIWVSVIGGLLFLIVHATWLRFFARSREFASDASPTIVARLPKRVPRHSLVKERGKRKKKIKRTIINKRV